MSGTLIIVGRRLALAVLSLACASVLIFVGTEILPGDVAQAILGQSATPETVAVIRDRLGLDQSPVERYLAWVAGVLQGDLGTSLSSGQPVAEMIDARLANTLFLAGTAALIGVPLALTLGLLAALYQNSWVDRSLSTSAVCTIAVPEFFVAYLLIAVLSVSWGLFPALATVHAGMDFWDRLQAVALPAMTLSIVILAHIMRLTRASVINALGSPYIETAILKGLSRIRIVLWHALPNAMSPIITVIVLNLAYLVVGVVVVEVIFVYPGIGQLMVDHVSLRDVPVVQACGLIFAATYILLNMLADILSVLSNPRLRHPSHKAA